MQSVSYQNTFGLTLAGHLFTPENFDANQKYPAIVVSHPASSCKDQTAGIYAKKLAENGFVTLVFDAAYQGESSGEPRFVENPTVRIEDIRASVDYLVAQNFVDEERIGVLGVCAGGAYAAAAAMIERRIKAVGTVVATNLGRLYREEMTGQSAIATLEAIGKQRTAEARGEAAKLTQWIPSSTEDVKAAGITDIDVTEAVDYYRTPRGQHVNSPNKLNFVSIANCMNFDAFHLAEKLLTQPLQIIAGEKAGGFGSYRDAFELYGKAASTEKNLHIVKNTSHYDLYDKPEAVAEALSKLVPFYQKYL
ncbi:alpha/beta hydrolase [Aggregatibacter actinomycetemcomitans]|nr:alpha/beta hydrolase [Aggregatibacter actinomycetemcomitans]